MQSAAADNLLDPPRGGGKSKEKIRFLQRGALPKEPVEAGPGHPD
jgi:hypothetical protein